MKLTLIIISVFLIGFSSLKESPNDFDYKLSNIARNFRLEIMDKTECERLREEAEGVVDDIRNAIKKADNYTTIEIIKLKQLKLEAEALEYFIAAVGNCGNYNMNIENFNLANRRIGASVSSVVKGKYCIDIIVVSIDDYVAFLGENNSINNYSVSYQWKVINGLNSGYGTMGLSKSSVRHIYDNRDKPSEKNISVFGISCVKF